MLMYTFDFAHVVGTVAVVGSFTLLQLPCWWLLRRYTVGDTRTFLGWMRSMPQQACTLRQMVKAAESRKMGTMVRERGYLVTMGNLVSHQLGQHSLLGVGAYSAVYEIHLLDVPYSICFKVMSSKNGSLEAVLLECDNLSLLEEVKGVPRVLAVSVEPLGFFMTQHGRNSTMSGWRKGQERPSEALVVGSIYRLCTILRDVHCLRMCHNDIKLNNVAVEVGQGGRVEVTLLDLGLMRSHGSFPWGCRRRRDPSKPLKPFYDPELIMGKRPCSEATEVYAVGYLVKCLLPLVSVTKEQMRHYSRLAMEPVARYRPTIQELVVYTHNALLKLLPDISPLSSSDSYPSVHLEDAPSSLRGHPRGELEDNTSSDHVQ